MITDKSKVAFYARVSSEEQAEGESVVHQFSFLDEYMKKFLDGDKDYYTDESLWYADEGVSAYSTSVRERPAIQRLFQDGREGRFQILLIKNASRLIRDDKEVFAVPDYLSSLGIQTIVVNDGFDSTKPNTRIFLMFSGFIAQRYSEEISMNVSIGMRQKAKAGQWATSLPPIGYKINKTRHKLEIDEQTRLIPRLIFEMYVDKLKGTQEISNTLRGMGIKTRRGNYYEKTHIRNIIKNVAYMGDTLYGKSRNVITFEYDEKANLESKKRAKKKVEDTIYIPDTHEPIVDRGKFWRAQEIMNERNLTPSRKTKAKHPLVGILSCSHCGSNIVCQGRTSKKARYYRCNTVLRYGKDSCELKSIKADKLEYTILQYLLKEASLFQERDSEAKGAIEVDSLNNRIKEIENVKRKLSKKQSKLADDQMEFEPYTEEVYRNMMIDLKRQIEDCDKQILNITNQIKEFDNQDVTFFHLKEMIAELERVDFEDKESLRVLFHTFIEKIVVSSNDTIETIRYKYSFV